jgi:hypothetical protein
MIFYLPMIFNKPGPSDSIVLFTRSFALGGVGTSTHENNSDFYHYINFYPIKGDKHRFQKFKIDNYEDGINIINKDQIIDIQMFGDSCINNISSAKMGDIKIIIKKLKNDKNQSSLLQKQVSTNCKFSVIILI